MRISGQLKTMIAGLLLLTGASLSPVRAADTDKPCSAPDLPMRPIVATHSIPPYPPISVMTNESGRTLLEVHIGADGVPTATSVMDSSGSLRLDAAAADYVKSTWRWNAPVRNCQPLAVVTRVSILWDLKNAVDVGPRPPTITMDLKDYPAGALARHEQGSVALSVVVSPDDAPMPILVKSSGFPELDEKSLALAKTWRFTPATMDGRPIVTPVFLFLVWSLDPKK